MNEKSKISAHWNSSVRLYPGNRIIDRQAEDTEIISFTNQSIIESILRFARKDAEEINQPLAERVSALEKIMSKQRAEEKIIELTPSKEYTIHEETDDDIEWELNRKYFFDHSEDIERDYPGQYVAIHKQKIIGSGDEFGSLVGRMYDEHGNILLYVDKPGEEEVIYLGIPPVS